MGVREINDGGVIDGGGLVHAWGWLDEGHTTRGITWV